MAVAGRDDGDARIEIEKTVAVHVLDDRAFSLLDHERIGTRVRRRQHCLVPLDHRLGARAGQRL